MAYGAKASHRAKGHRWSTIAGEGGVRPVILKRRIVPTGEPCNTETVPHGSVGGRGKRRVSDLARGLPNLLRRSRFQQQVSASVGRIFAVPLRHAVCFRQKLSAFWEGLCNAITPVTPPSTWRSFARWSRLVRLRAVSSTTPSRGRFSAQPSALLQIWRVCRGSSTSSRGS